MKYLIIVLFIIFGKYNLFGQDQPCIIDSKIIDPTIKIYEDNADLNIQNNKFYEAAINYSEIIKKYPANTRYIFKRGMMYMAAKHYKAAKEDFDMLITSGTDNIPEVYFYRGLCKIMDQNGSVNPDGCNDIAKLKEMGFKADLTGFQYICKNL